MSDPTVETEYNQMNAEQQARFADQHFELLTPEQQTHKAIEDFNTGRQLNGQEAGIVDRTLGNGDGVLDQKDLQKIEEDRNDKAFNQALAGAATVMADAAIASVEQSSVSAAMSGQGGAGLSSMFSVQANLDKPELGIGGALSALFDSKAAPQSAFSNPSNNFQPGSLQSIFTQALGGSTSPSLQSMLDSPSAKTSSPQIDQSELGTLMGPPNPAIRALGL